MAVALANDPVLYSFEVSLNDSIANGLNIHYQYRTVPPDPPAQLHFDVIATTLAAIDDAAYPAGTLAPGITAAAAAQGYTWP